MARAFPPAFCQQFFDENGKPLAAGKLYTYIAGSSTPVLTYKEISGDSPANQNTNPIILDSAGYAKLVLEDDKAYKLVLKDKNDALKFTWDNVTCSSGGGGGTGDSDRLWAHWENENNWHNVSDQYTFPNSDYQKSEGELTDSQYPYLKAGLYRFTMEVALRNYPSVYDAIEKCDISVKYGSQSLRAQTFLFDRTIPFGAGLAETVWFGGIFRMPADGEVSVYVDRTSYSTPASMKCSHIFINKLGD